MPEFTGERVVPGQVDADLFNEHFSRYAFARRWAQYRRVLDLGCGVGYGAAALAEVADQVTALDSSQEAVAYAREHYGRANLHFEQADVTTVRSGRFDLITAFEVIEHLEDWRGLLQAAREQLAEGGLFLVSTPNRPVYCELRAEAGRNPFHVHEFDEAEFRTALEEMFPHVALFVQNHSAGILFAPVERTNSFDVTIAEGFIAPEQANFFIGICTLEPLLNLENFFWIPSTANLLRERDRHVALLRGEVEAKTRWMAEGRAELDARNREYAELLHHHHELKLELEERNRWALEQSELLRERGERIHALQAEVEAEQAEFGRAVAAYEAHTAELEAANREIAKWAGETERRLTAESDQRGQDLVHSVALLDQAEETVRERTLWAQGLDRELREWQQRFSTLRGSPWVRAGSRLRFIADRK